MKKSDAVKIFGTRAAMAAALGISRSAVSQWPETLSDQYADRVIGAALRNGNLSFEESLKYRDPPTSGGDGSDGQAVA